MRLYLTERESLLVRFLFIGTRICDGDFLYAHEYLLLQGVY